MHEAPDISERAPLPFSQPSADLALNTAPPSAAGKGGKNRRRGKNDATEKRELIFKEDGQGTPIGPSRLPPAPPLPFTKPTAVRALPS